MTALLFTVLIVACFLAWRRCRKMHARWQQQRNRINRIEAEVRQCTEAYQQAWIDAWNTADQRIKAAHAAYEGFRRPRLLQIKSEGSI